MIGKPTRRPLFCAPVARHTTPTTRTLGGGVDMVARGRLSADIGSFDFSNYKLSPDILKILEQQKQNALNDFINLFFCDRKLNNYLKIKALCNVNHILHFNI